MGPTSDLLELMEILNGIGYTALCCIFEHFSELCCEHTVAARWKTRNLSKLLIKEAELSSLSLSVWLCTKSETWESTSKTVILLQTLKIIVFCSKKMHAVTLGRITFFSLWWWWETGFC